jgi:hypothetical protein
MLGKREGLVLLKKVPTASDLRNMSIRHFYGTVLSEKDVRELLSGARPVAPEDPMLENWSFSPWCSVEFDDSVGRHRLQLFLGGLARLECPDGTRGMLMLPLESWTPTTDPGKSRAP